MLGIGRGESPGIFPGIGNRDSRFFSRPGKNLTETFIGIIISQLYQMVYVDGLLWGRGFHGTLDAR
jgi:hypothetical protein